MIKGKTPGDVDKAVESSGQNVKAMAGMRYSELDQRSRADQIVTHLNKAGFVDVGTAVLSSCEIQVAVSGRARTPSCRDT